ncbi:hypothetical protein C9374_001800 [Naegleria lovaniensis]|uniref:Uncharacterized protein n=1 Tax=Naegleria lovaniensis TaxID=51637 RepID=A0AA88GW75_NAELO|nr:uncharacterized protein C9374_001800 [Naegleria lovaniensis]KAG2387468.1 hypothetical protein C9374_001800 [Naegleria lovaniensis]
MGSQISKTTNEDFTKPKTNRSSSSNTKKPEDIVLDKVLANPIIKQKLGNNIQQMRMFAQQLSDPEELKESYLHTDWVQTTKLISDISNKVNEDASSTLNSNSSDLIRRGSQLLQSTQSANDMKIIGNFNSTMSNSQGEGDLINMEISKQPPIQLKDKIRIKLLVTETARNSTDRTIRQLLSPVLNSFNVLPEMGMFHTALIVGPWKLEFNDSGIVVPRKIMSQAAVLTADIDYISTVDRLEEVIDTLAKVICKWNVNMIYKQTGGDPTKHGNCQDFVDDCLAALGVKLNFEGALKNFITRLKKTGNSKLQFEMTREFIEKFKLVDLYPSLRRALDNSSQETKSDQTQGGEGSGAEDELPAGALVFQTHKDLDRFVWYLMQQDYEFQNHYPCEYQLLKSFDRAFWVKALTYPNMEQFHPLYEDEDMNVGAAKSSSTSKQASHNEERKQRCPFGDPCASSFIYL